MRTALVVGVLALAACERTPEVRDTGAPGPAGAQPPAAAPAERELLERLANAERAVESSGWKTLVHGPPGASRETRLRIARFADGRTRIAWEGTGDPPERRWETRARAPWASRTDLVLRNYAVTADPGPGPTVAWRTTERVRFVPRRPLRPSVELLADAETGLVLQPRVIEQHSAAPDGLARDWPPHESGAEKNEGYALQWYSLAALAVVLALVLSFRKD